MVPNILFFRGNNLLENSLNGWFVLVQALTKRKNGFHPRKSATCMNTMKFLHEIHDVKKQDSPFETLKRYSKRLVMSGTRPWAMRATGASAALQRSCSLAVAAQLSALGQQVGTQAPWIGH